MTQNRESRVRRAGAAACIMALAVAFLSGCTPTAPQISASAATGLQASVLAVTDAASAGNADAAVTDLNTLQAQLREATASGAVTAERTSRIQAAIDLVRADLAALRAPGSGPSPTAPPPTAPSSTTRRSSPSPTSTSVPTSPAPPTSSSPPPTPTTSTTQTSAPAPTPSQANTGGNGNGHDNGNGNGHGNDKKGKGGG